MILTNVCFMFMYVHVVIILILGVLVLMFLFWSLTQGFNSGEEVLNGSLDAICWLPACHVGMLGGAGIGETQLELERVSQSSG